MPRVTHRFRLFVSVVLVAAATVCWSDGAAAQGLRQSPAPRRQPAAGQPSAARPVPDPAPPAGSDRAAEFRRLRPDMKSPIPNLEITKDTYYRWLEFSRHFEFARSPTNHGQYGPRHFMPVLVHFVHTRDPASANACLTMLRTYDTWLRKQVADEGWHVHFCQEPGYIAVYQQVLSRAGRLSDADRAMLRDLYLFMARNIHAWATPETFWRGPMHRAQGEGVLKGLAAAWYPDAPESGEWGRYAARVYDDWWQFRDLAPNDSNYFLAALQPLAIRAMLWNDDAFFTDPGMKPLWDRLVDEMAPDGSLPPYGSHWGWNQGAGVRIAVLEAVAAKTRDGRYRFAAHRLMNYLLYQRMQYRQNHMLIGPDTTEPLSLAYLWADDSVKPVTPDSGSRILTRRETIRVPSPVADQKKGATAVFGATADIDPRPDRGHIDCCMLVTRETKPSKLVLRSGWDRGDFFVLVDLFPRHDPLNPLGLLGINRWGATLACTTNAKGYSRENRVVIERLDPPPRRVQVVPETTIDAFGDAPMATYVSARVTNYDETTATAVRRFLFVKNRFLLVRDEIRLPAEGRYRVTSVFNTQKAERIPGTASAVTWFDAPQMLGTPLLNPPVNLLVSFIPADGFSLDIVDRSPTDESMKPVPLQLRYATEASGKDAEGPHLRTAMLLRPQAPTDRFPQGLPGAGPDAAGVEVLCDTPESLAILLRHGTEEEIAVLNPGAVPLTLRGTATRAPAAYFRLIDGRVVDQWAHPN
jgi:hypothetical protein